MAREKITFNLNVFTLIDQATVISFCWQEALSTLAEVSVQFFTVEKNRGRRFIGATSEFFHSKYNIV
ncbi:hypothetical protein BGC07_10910 [Piscirickettsia litoralis]|uniref:Uncharacterized protein n=2 Tax=Piscirickettsia litoralis TaxID=1891921 RepID=A0ABX3A6M6_9GAMM|nr:hypothetical protein BGC07_10910 [Piscirickettsia litoralis]